MRGETTNLDQMAHRKITSDGPAAREHRIVLDDLDDPIVPATPATNIVGGAFVVVIVLAMVPGVVDTAPAKN